MSFFGTEEAYAVVLAKATDKGPELSGPGSSGKSRLIAAASFGAKKDTHILGKSILSILTELNASSYN